MAKRPDTLVKEWIAKGQREIYVNIINLTPRAWGVIEPLLEKTGYIPDDLGPQRVYTLPLTPCVRCGVKREEEFGTLDNLCQECAEVETARIEQKAVKS